MADRSPRPDSIDDTEAENGVASEGGTPRWVKVSGIIALAVVLLFIVLQVTGVAPDHGPGLHGGDDDTPSSVVEQDGGHTPVEHGR